MSLVAGQVTLSGTVAKRRLRGENGANGTAAVPRPPDCHPSEARPDKTANSAYGLRRRGDRSSAATNRVNVPVDDAGESEAHD
jgi:hypothetical protein